MSLGRVQSNTVHALKPPASSRPGELSQHAEGGRNSTNPGLTWQVADGWEAAITGPEAPDWSRLDRDPRAQLIKSNPGRRTWAISIEGRQLYVKEFITTSIGDLIRRLRRGPPAEAEWRAGEVAKRRNVPAVRSIACGLGRRRGYLVSPALPGAATLSAVWQEVCSTSDPAQRARRLGTLTEAVAHLLAQAHRHGFWHSDHHPGNVLVAPCPAGGFEAFYADLHGLRLTGGIVEARAIKALAQMNQWFRLRATRNRRLRFLLKYCTNCSNGARPEGRTMLRRILPDVVRETHRQALMLWNQRDRRITGHNKYFAPLRIGYAIRGYVTLRLGRRHVPPTPMLPDRTLAEWKNWVQAWSGKNEEPVPPGTRLLVDRCQRGLLDRIRRRFESSRLSTAFIMAHRLRHRDMPCQFPLAVVDRTTDSRTVERALLLPSEPETMDLGIFVGSEHAAPAVRRQVCRNLADLVSLMADRGASVRHVRRSTFAVVPEAWDVIVDEPTDVTLQRRDPDGDWLETTIGLRDLLVRNGGLSRAEAVRFLKRLAPRDWKSLWRTVANYRRKDEQ